MTEVRETLAEELRNIGMFLALALSSCVTVSKLLNLYASAFSSAKWEWYSCLKGDLGGGVIKWEWPYNQIVIESLAQSQNSVDIIYDYYYYS